MPVFTRACLALALAATFAAPAVAQVSPNEISRDDILQHLHQMGHEQARFDHTDATRGVEILYLADYLIDPMGRSPAKAQYFALKAFDTPTLARDYEALLTNQHREGRFLHPSRFAALGRYVVMPLPENPGSAALAISAIGELRHWAETQDPGAPFKDPSRWADEIPELDDGVTPANYMGVHPLHDTWLDADDHLREKGAKSLSPEAGRRAYRVGGDVVRLVGSQHHTEQVSIVVVTPPKTMTLTQLQTKYGKPTRQQTLFTPPLGEVSVSEWKALGVVALTETKAPHAIRSINYHHPQYPDVVYYLEPSRQYQAVGLTFAQPASWAPKAPMVDNRVRPAPVILPAPVYPAGAQ